MPHQAPHANSFENSLFCQRLKKLATASGSTTELQNLRTATERLVSHAQAISDQIVRHLPQFTLHNGTHLWNVLSFMEELAGGKAAIEKLGAGDCAMAVWAAFTHDLGMVLEASELAALDAADHFDTSADVQGKPTTWSDQRVQDWRAYRDGHEHWSTIRQDPHSEKSRMKLGIIRAAFIRDSHARQDAHSGHCRIADWVAFIAQGDRLIAQALEDFSLDERIVRVAVSHNQDIAWLPRQLSILGCDPHAEHDAELGTIHWTWLGWLLRLADVFDCDASRTPRILFDHGGITDHRSRNEWQKHLAIRTPPTWGAGHDHQTLLYTCHLSPSPVVEKAIHQIIGWMNDEIAKCRAAWNALSETQRCDLNLALPSEAKLEIRKCAGDYLYQDIEFRLDRDAVVELLMGESLYGGPELALRELVQNALDAVHLRDQRNKLAIALEKAGNQERARQPHEPWGATSGEVHVTWGTEPDGRSWIKVQDNGVGMTVATMRRFLTQIGKSYYKSDEFHAEQELMRRHGILCTAISQFGIGFLSVFMLADHVEIHTRPVGAKDDPDKAKPNWKETERFPFRADIHGPNGLLAFYPHEVRQTGTTVTLWLKEKFVLAEWDRERLLRLLKEEFYEPAFQRMGVRFDPRDTDRRNHSMWRPNTALLDPAFEVARFVVWPRYPVRLANGALVLDNAFHFTHLLSPLDRGKLCSVADEWGCPAPELAQAEWEACVWEDVQINALGEALGTGSRVKIIALTPQGSLDHPKQPRDWALCSDRLPSGAQRMSLSTFVEPLLPNPQLRYQCLVNGLRIVPGLVPSSESRDCRLMAILEMLPLLPGPGCWVWIDLHSDAMPRLRADRSTLTNDQTEAWKTTLSGLYERWLNAWPRSLPSWVAGLTLRGELNSKLQKSGVSHRISIPRCSLNSIAAAWIAEQSVTKRVVESLPGYEPRRIPRDIGMSRESRLTLPRHLDRSIEAALERATCLTLEPSIRVKFFNSLEEADFEHSRLEPLRRRADLVMQSVSDKIWKRAFAINQFPKLNKEAWVSGLMSHVCSEAFWPNLPQAHPIIERQATEAVELVDLQLNGPLHLDATIRVTLTPWMSDYDVMFPFTAFALPRLRQLVPDWMVEQAWRNVFMLPFLLGAEPLNWRSVVLPSPGFDRLMLFLPNPDHYEWLFAEHTQEEWNQGSASALWDLETGEVLYADGIHTEASLRAEGKPLRKWLGVK